MEVLIIRHGLPHSVEATTESEADPSLDDEGIRQASLLAASLAHGDYGTVTAIVSSSMRRAQETAAPFAAVSGLPVAVDPRLVEFDAGSREYGNIMTRYATRAEMWDRINDGQWGALRFDPQAFVARAVAGVEAAILANAATPNGVVAIFCHGGVVGAYIAHVLRAPRPFFFPPAYTGVSRFLALPDGYRELVTVNETRHLPRP